MPANLHTQYTYSEATKWNSTIVVCSSMVDFADVNSGEQLSGSSTTPCWFPLCFWTSLWAFASFPAYVCICWEPCVDYVFLCVCGPRRCLIIPGLCRGLSLGLPLPTVKFPLLTARTMQTLPRLSTTSASPLAAIYRPQPQVYLCLRHPIISSWCSPEKGPMAAAWETVWQLSIQPHPNFLFQWQTVRKLERQTINQAGIGGFKVQVGIWLV